ncbi:hypothetical protein JN01_0130 [Entomoplasma freundtii]|uniref:Uncharacterized protein n=1 Tax=Entomoplasma freundtii TaxID=74700 RepID=A0A2K8NS60_9MOLU|nr:hypothetical protein [Entomoplasma freundtii]ATZ16649.1 hypothetical protein EFREU_v1c06290 [Entomoplasma freundtii]TDY58184.1 hypothetical protein JN01_0130 [Entomoplasma freundtii]
MLATQENFIVGLSLLITGLILGILTSFLMWFFKRRNRRNTLKQYHHESSWWGFIKKNFPLFLVLFFVVMAITGLAMMI